MGTTAIKSGCVIACKVMTTVEAAGLRGYNKSSLPGLIKKESEHSSICSMSTSLI